jgi:hypothetical protein
MCFALPQTQAKIGCHFGRDKAIQHMREKQFKDEV